ncbi:PP2C family protein-serine/threonine phosphatase [Aeromicrobium sp.]|uniref:PP2C family protein-serine/threonine phosphatase n=1 Tax=Aeromicrobium sp. TaxID=1871063 RepID=UPI003C32F321
MSSVPPEDGYIRPDGRDAAAARVPKHPLRAVAIISIVGFALTVLSTWGVARTDENTEQRLLQVQSKQAAAVLSSAALVVQQPMKAALDVQAFAEGGRASVFERGMGTSVGTDEGQFVSASLWHQEQGRIRNVAKLGVSPGVDGSGPDGQAFLGRALKASTAVVQRVDVGGQVRLAWALVDPETGYVVYAERAVPADRRSRVDRDSAFADLSYAIYIGKGTDLADLSTTDVDPADLPLKGVTYRTEVPFADTVITLVTSPRRHLGSPLSQRLPLILGVGGLLLTIIAALVARQLVRARSEAEANTETITALYERDDVLHEEQRSLFVRLQRALLPQVIPDIPQIEIASEYVAGAQGVDIGGDWYSVIAVDDDHFAFVVGDVSGHGVDAVAVMAHARFTLRAYLVDGDSPQQALEKCSRQFDISVDDHMVTAIVGIGNWRSGEMVMANAGHPPPLLVTDGQTEYVSIPAGPPLGIGPSSYESTTVTMTGGSTLILYTDGLIERRTEDIDTGMRRLADVVGPIASDPVEALVDQVLTSLRDEDAADDIAVLALRRLSS